MQNQEHQQMAFEHLHTWQISVNCAPASHPAERHVPMAVATLMAH